MKDREETELQSKSPGEEDHQAPDILEEIEIEDFDPEFSRILTVRRLPESWPQ